MKKKILYGILISSVIALPIISVAASSDSNEKVNGAKIKQELNEVAKEKEGAEEPEVNVNILNIAAIKVNLDYFNKENVYLKNAKRTSNVLTRNFDKEIYEVEVKSITPDIGNKSARVTFILKHKKTGITSIEFTKRITGFKEIVVVTDNINDIEKFIILDYPGKEKVYAAHASKNNVQFSNYDDSSYRLMIKTTSFNTEMGTLTVTFSVKSKITKSIIGEITKTISGFSIPMVTLDELNAEARKVNIEYYNRENVYVKSAAHRQRVITSGFNKNLYEFIVKNATANENKRSLYVTYVVKYKVTGMVSDEITKEIVGFKRPTPSNDINVVAKKVKIYYPKKENIFARNAKIEAVTSSYYNKNEYELVILDIIPNNSTKWVLVNFYLKNKKTGEKSNNVTKTITGFKEEIVMNENIDDVLRMVRIDYPNKQDIFPKEIDRSKFETSNYDKEQYEVQLVKVFPYNLRGVVGLTFTIKDKTTGETSKAAQKTISGFKISE